MEQSVLLWVLLGPALITFGGVWARITQTGAAEKYGEDDFFVQKARAAPLGCQAATAARLTDGVRPAAADGVACC
jgi:hypothetical protein